MESEHWQCQQCGHEVYDEEGETGEINGIIEEADGVYADDPCIECGGRMKRIDG